MTKKLCLALLLLGLTTNIDKPTPPINYPRLERLRVEELTERWNHPEKIKIEEFSINYDKIIEIESSGNPLAYNKHSKARGLMQITPIVLKEWNKFNAQKHTSDDLFNPEINKKIGEWYLDRIKDHYLPHYKIEQNIDNILIAYNWGIGNLKKYLSENSELPLGTQGYIKKYKAN